MAPRETENNVYAKFWGDKQRALWYVMVFLEWSITTDFGLVASNDFDTVNEKESLHPADHIMIIIIIIIFIVFEVKTQDVHLVSLLL